MQSIKQTRYRTNTDKLESVRWVNETGKYHRVDGPAYIGYNVHGKVWLEEWYVNGAHHRVGGPAFEQWRSDIGNNKKYQEAWYLHGEYHRLDGPAVIYYESDGETPEMQIRFINGIEYKTEAEFQVAVDLYKANEIAELF